VSWRSATGKVEGPGEQLARIRCWHRLRSIASSLGEDGQEVLRGPGALPLLPRGHPRLTPALGYLGKRSWIFFSPLQGLLLHSVLPPSTVRASKSTALAGPGTRRTTSGVTNAAPATLPLCTSRSPQPSSRLPQSGSELWPYRFHTQHPQIKQTILNPNPPQTPICPTTSSKIVPVLPEQAGRARPSASAVPARMCSTELNPAR